MARPEEKSRSMLSLFTRRHTMNKADIERPKHTKRAQTVDEAQIFYRHVTREIAHEIGLIQNSGLGEFALRQKNDYINTLLTERRAWENRIAELGGIEFAETLGIDCSALRREQQQKQRDAEWREDMILQGKDPDKVAEKQAKRRHHHQQQQPPSTQPKTGVIMSTKRIGLKDSDGSNALGVDGYFYFGAAKDLPGVRELFEHRQFDENSASASHHLNRNELLKRASPIYYGYLEDDNFAMIREETALEQSLWEAALATQNTTQNGHLENDTMQNDDDDDDDGGVEGDRQTDDNSTDHMDSS